MAGKLDAFLDQTRKLKAKVEIERKAEKAPHLAAGQGVDAKFGAMTAALDTTIKILRAPLTAWLEKKQFQAEITRRAAEAKVKAAEEASRKAATAAIATGTIASQMAEDVAQAKVKAAQDTAKAIPTRAGVKHEFGTRTTTLRTYVEVEVTNVAKVPVQFLRLVSAEAVEKALRQALKDGKIGPGSIIPGVNITERKQAS